MEEADALRKGLDAIHGMDAVRSCPAVVKQLETWKHARALLPPSGLANDDAEPPTKTAQENEGK